MSGYVFISLDPISTGGEICAPVGPKGRADFGSLFGLGVSRRSRPRTTVGKGDCETTDYGMELHKLRLQRSQGSAVKSLQQQQEISVELRAR